MTSVNLSQYKIKLKHKHNKKKHQIFNAEIKKKIDFLSLKSDIKKKVDNKVAVLFKNVINKIFSSEWIADSDFFLYITDQLQLFKRSLIQIRCWWIKIKRKHLYFCYYEIIIMQDKKKIFVNLSLMLYVFKLRINFFCLKSSYVK